MATRSKAAGSYTPFSKRLTGSIDNISKTIEDNAKLMDMIQEVALELTHSIGTMHTLTVRYAGAANGILDVLSPVVRRLPLVPKRATSMMTKLERVTRSLVANQAKTGKTIADVQRGLYAGNVNLLKGHATQLKSLSRNLVKILPK